MKDLINKKWLGVLVVVLYSLFLSAKITMLASTSFNEYSPIFTANINDFLPVTFENGQIVAPKDTIITKKIDNVNIVLNTQIDTFDTESLTEEGIYVSRKNIYTKDTNKNKIQIQSLSQVPNMILDSEAVASGMTAIEKYLVPVSLIFVFAFSMIFSGIAILIYTVIFHWIMSKVYHVSFAQTLRLNCYGYVLISLFSVLGIFSVNVLVTLALLIIFNALINSSLKNA